MATLKNNGLRACLALMVLLFGVFMAVNAMNKSESVEDNIVKAPTTYFYNGPAINLSSNVMNASNWSTSQATGLSCGYPTEIPCSLNVPEGKSISTHLSDLGNLSGVKSATSTRRNAAP